MNIPISIAKKILYLLEPNTKLRYSALKHKVVEQMIEDGVVLRNQVSASRAYISIVYKEMFIVYLSNHFGINDLQIYIQELENNESSRATNIVVASDSKLISVRTCKGFLVNSYQPIEAKLHDEHIIIHPIKGSFMYISDFEHFSLDASVTIVGIENVENFANIEFQKYLFQNIKPLFVSRYPQSNDLVKWLQQIPNNYLHFGDLDVAGINIYMNEYKKYLGDKASFFLPPQADSLFQKHGNRTLYNLQKLNKHTLIERSLLQLIDLIHKHKKGLEQEVFIRK